jgi:hypothetical protein
MPVDDMRIVSSGREPRPATTAVLGRVHDEPEVRPGNTNRLVELPQRAAVRAIGMVVVRPYPPLGTRIYAQVIDEQRVRNVAVEVVQWVSGRIVYTEAVRRRFALETSKDRP